MSVLITGGTVVTAHGRDVAEFWEPRAQTHDVRLVSLG